jgi:hypothetical protein
MYVQFLHTNTHTHYNLKGFTRPTGPRVLFGASGAGAFEGEGVAAAGWGGALLGRAWGAVARGSARVLVGQARRQLRIRVPVRVQRRRQPALARAMAHLRRMGQLVSPTPIRPHSPAGSPSRFGAAPNPAARHGRVAANPRHWPAGERLTGEPAVSVGSGETHRVSRRPRSWGVTARTATTRLQGRCARSLCRSSRALRGVRPRDRRTAARGGTPQCSRRAAIRTRWSRTRFVFPPASHPCSGVAAVMRPPC